MQIMESPINHQYHQQILQFQFLMKAVRAIHSGLTAFDLFSAQQFLRYKGDNDYKTATGGFCSLCVIIIFIILFINSGIIVINKSSVTVSEDFQHHTVPSLTTLTASPEGKFMFAVNVVQTGIYDANYTYFTVELYQNADPKKTFNGNNKSILVPLVPCTKDHLDFGEEIQSIYDQFQLNYWLCPPLGYEFKFSGDFLTDYFQYVSLFISKCKTSMSSNCAPDALVQSKINTFGSLTAAFVYVNTQLNPSQTKDYITYFLESRNFFSFSTNLAARAFGRLQDYEIDTDTSLLPIQKITVESGASFPDLFQRTTIPVINNTYVSVRLEKSPYSVTYTRSFRKIDDFLSYVGGLVGLVLTLIFIIGKYAELSYQISLGGRLFRLNKEEAIESGSFNFLTYLTLVGFRVCRFFGCCAKFQMMEAYQRCHEQIQKQIDIQIILQRIATLERAAISAVGKDDFQMLHFADKPTLQQAKVQREHSYLYRKYAKKDEKMIGSNQTGSKQVNELFSEESSFTSMHSNHYKSFKNQFKKNAKEGSNGNKFLSQQFLQRFRGLESDDQYQREMQNKNEAAKRLVGEDYFKQLQTVRLKESSNIRQPLKNYNENDKL